MPLYQTLGVPLGDEGDIQNKNILQLIKEVFAVGKQRGLQELLRCQQQNIRLVALVELFVGTDPPQNVGGFGDLAEAVLQIALDCLERGEPVRFDIEQP